MFSFRVDGVKSAMRKLRRLPAQAQRHALRPALRKAAGVVAKQARKEAPKGKGLTPAGLPRKHLKRTIKTTSVKWYRKTGTFAIIVGPEKNAAPHAHLVHNGTRAKVFTISKPLVLGGAYIPAGTTINHPGTRANPFLARAVDKTRGQTQEKLRTEILAGIHKQVQKMKAKK